MFRYFMFYGGRGACDRVERECDVLLRSSVLRGLMAPGCALVAGLSDCGESDRVRLECVLSGSAVVSLMRRNFGDPKSI